jgi:DNA repair exonuclease SbcCD ATPase subunit
MSPIGRVFIVLNLLLAGVFVGFSGTYLQKQDNFKKQLEAEKTAHTTAKTAWDQERTRLEKERTDFEIAKTARETELNAVKNARDQLSDEKKQLSQQLASLEADLKALRSVAEAGKSQSDAAFKQAEDAYKMAMADQKAKDEAINQKNVFEAENRTLKTQIASLEETVKTKDLAIADLEKTRNELNLLVSVAQAKCFMPSMAAPKLAGKVTHASGNLATIAVTDNPGNVDIQSQINQRKFSFAVYDANTYKGEAVATEYVASQNAVLCTLIPAKNQTIRTGDMASTGTN